MIGEKIELEISYKKVGEERNSYFYYGLSINLL
jgi:hypothetical protein